MSDRNYDMESCPLDTKGVMLVFYRHKDFPVSSRFRGVRNLDDSYKHGL